ncbi:phosphopantetheine-binding protein [Streptomyces sp. NPDC001709]
MDSSTAGEIRQRSAEVWSEVLQGPPPADGDDFFEAGGTSLKAIRFCARLGSVLGHKVPVKILLRHSTFGAFVQALDTSEDLALR